MARRPKLGIPPQPANSPLRRQIEAEVRASTELLQQVFDQVAPLVEDFDLEQLVRDGLLRPVPRSSWFEVDDYEALPAAAKGHVVNEGRDSATGRVTRVRFGRIVGLKQFVRTMRRRGYTRSS